MDFCIDKDYIVDCLKTLVNTPSPVGYYKQLNPVLLQLAKKLGYDVSFDNRHTAYITLDGQDNSKTVVVGAHADTLGLMVSSIESNGMLKVRSLGGGTIASYEGESVTVYTRGGKSYTGLIICKSHSAHVFDDAHTLERKIDNMRIILDENVSSKQDVLDLGICNGDVIAVDPRFTYTKTGYIKSRHIDDKGGIACCFAMLKHLAKNNLKPKYKTILTFPYYEEVGLGGCYVPQDVSEYIALDIGLIGPELDGNEHSVSICAKDNAAPYDYDLTSRLIEQAKAAGCEYAVDVYYRYSTDGQAAQRAGNNLISGCFGMAVYCSHGMERTHIDGLLNTTKLLIAYVLGI